LRVDMRMELSKLHHDLGATMIYVTHDQVEAMTLADKIVVLNGGVVQQVGSPIELYQRPANQFVAGFIGSPRMNFVPVAIQSISVGGLTVSSQDIEPTHVPADTTGLKAGDTVTLGIRPHALITDAAATLRGEVSLVERLGNETNVSLRLPSGTSWLAVLDGDRDLRIDQELPLSFEPELAAIFDADGQARYRK